METLFPWRSAWEPFLHGRLHGTRMGTFVGPQWSLHLGTSHGAFNADNVDVDVNVNVIVDADVDVIVIVHVNLKVDAKADAVSASISMSLCDCRACQGSCVDAGDGGGLAGDVRLGLPPLFPVRPVVLGEKRKALNANWLVRI